MFVSASEDGELSLFYISHDSRLERQQGDWREEGGRCYSKKRERERERLMNLELEKRRGRSVFTSELC